MFLIKRMELIYRILDKYFNTSSYCIQNVSLHFHIFHLILGHKYINKIIKTR